MDWQASAACCIFLAIALAAPPAAAESVAGGLAVRSLRIDSPSGVLVQPAAFFLPDADSLSGFRLQAPALHVERHDIRTLSAPLAGGSFTTGREEATYDVRDARVGATGAGGWLGALTKGGELSVRAVAPAVLAASGDEVVGRQGFQVGSAQFAAFEAPVPGPHLRGALAGDAVYRGPIRLVVFGPDLVVASPANQTREPTGVETGSGAVQERVERWVVLTAPWVELSLGTRAPIELAATQGRVQWRGAAEVAAAEGRIETPSSRYAATTGDDTLSGDLEAALAPRDDRAFDLALSGDLEATSLHPVPVPREADLSLPPEALWVALGLLAAVGGGGVALNAWSRHRAPTSFSVDQAAELADLAIAEGRLDEALAWIRHARQLAPASRRLLLDEAYCLGALGREAEALALYDSAGPDPDAHFRAALLIARDPARLAHAEARLALALSLQPALAADVPADLARKMQGRPGFERALADARAAMGDEPAQP